MHLVTWQTWAGSSAALGAGMGAVWELNHPDDGESNHAVSPLSGPRRLMSTRALTAK